MCMPAFIPTSKSAFKYWFKYVGIMMMILAVVFSATKITYKTPEFVQEGTAAFSEMNRSDVYQLSDMIVFDQYSYYEDKQQTQVYLIGIYDKDETMKFASLVTDNADTEIFERLNAYLDDEEQQVGDCILEGCFTVSSFKEFDRDARSRNDLQRFYNEMTVSFRQDFNAEQTGLVFKFACSTQQDFDAYMQSVKSSNIKWAAVAAALTAGGIVFIIIGVLLGRKDRKNYEQSFNGGIYFDPYKTEQTQAEENDITKQPANAQPETVYHSKPFSEQPVNEPSKTNLGTVSYQASEQTFASSEPIGNETAQGYTPIYNNMPVNTAEYTPKKSKAPKIIGRILSVVLLVFSLFMLIGAATAFLEGEPEYIPSDRVDLFNIESPDVYELNNLKIISKYESDEYRDYYLALYPDKDGTEKAISLVCYRDNGLFPVLRGNAQTADIISVGAAEYFSSKDEENSYKQAFEAYNSKLEKPVLSTGLSFEFVCQTDRIGFYEYCQDDRQTNIFIAVFTVIVMLAGILLASFSFRKSKEKKEAYPNDIRENNIVKSNPYFLDYNYRKENDI